MNQCKIDEEARIIAREDFYFETKEEDPMFPSEFESVFRRNPQFMVKANIDNRKFSYRERFPNKVWVR